MERSGKSYPVTFKTKDLRGASGYG